jgi:spore maturation protein CgeB
LLSGGAVLKIASPYSFRQWYYDRLIPWENYVPVNSDFSDLIEKVEWLVANEAKAMEIGKRGYELANAMTYEAEVQSAGKVIFRALVDRAAGLGLSGVTNQ